MSSSQQGSTGKEGAFHTDVPKQRQDLPGLEQDMKPKSEPVKLEAEDGFIEYKGNNKLKDKKAIITGGE